MVDLGQSITFLHTRDLEATSKFYQDVLGLALARDQGNCRIFRIRQASFLGFCSHLEPTHPEGIILTFVTDQVDEWYSRLSSLGVEFTKPPAHNPKYGIYHCFFKDPNGYLLEIQKFDDPLS